MNTLYRFSDYISGPQMSVFLNFIQVSLVFVVPLPEKYESWRVLSVDPTIFKSIHPDMPDLQTPKYVHFAREVSNNQ
jgi:hypothetical protein